MGFSSSMGCYKKIDPFADTETKRSRHTRPNWIRYKKIDPFADTETGKFVDCGIVADATKKSIRLRILKQKFTHELAINPDATKKSIRLRILKRLDGVLE